MWAKLLNVEATALIACSAIRALAQQPLPPPVPNMPTLGSSLIVDCSTVGNSPGCKSFNEMVSKNDKDVLAIFNTSDNFVCFGPDEDTFLTLNFETPEEFQFKKRNHSYFETEGMISYQKYEDGVRNDDQLVLGTWMKLTQSQKSPTFRTIAKSGPYASIDDTEISFTYKFTNRRETTTTYTLQIRRSTLRFLESFAWNIPPDAKAKTSTTTHEHNEIRGYCSQMKQ